MHVVQDRLKFKDAFGPGAEKPLQERYDAGELEGKDLFVHFFVMLRKHVVL